MSKEYLMIKYIPALFIFSLLSACGSVTQPCPLGTGSEARVYVVEHGWHVDIGIPVEQLGKDLAFYRQIFSGARVIMFGYGKKTFFTAPPETLSEYFLGPLPGTAAIQVVGLSVTPLEAYPPEDVIVLKLPQNGSKALSTFIWNDIAKDEFGRPRIIAHSEDPDGLFYEALSGYSLFHTCNTWSADALHAAGLPPTSGNVIFSSQVMSQVESTAEAQCH